jgi:hypothetical protein
VFLLCRLKNHQKNGMTMWVEFNSRFLVQHPPASHSLAFLSFCDSNLNQKTSISWSSSMLHSRWLQKLFKIVNTVHLPGGVPLIHKSPVGGMCLMSCVLWFLRLVGCRGNSLSKFVEMWLEMHSWSMLFDSLTSAKRFYFIHLWCEIWLNWCIVLCAYSIHSCVWGIQWRRGVLGLTGQATRAAEDQISDISIFSNFTKFFVAWSLTLKLTSVHRQRWVSTCFPRALMILLCWVHACLLLLFVVSSPSYELYSQKISITLGWPHEPAMAGLTTMGKSIMILLISGKGP